MWTLDRVAERGAEIPRQVAAWMVGDGSVVEQQVTETRTKYPGLYQSLLADRNRAWVPRIDAMLDEPGSVFVLVGDSHLVGDDGIPALLTRSGRAAARVDQRVRVRIAVRSRRGSRRGGAPADDGGASRAVSSTPAKSSPVARGPSRAVTCRSRRRRRSVPHRGAKVRDRVLAELLARTFLDCGGLLPVRVERITSLVAEARLLDLRRLRIGRHHDVVVLFEVLHREAHGFLGRTGPIRKLANRHPAAAERPHHVRAECEGQIRVAFVVERRARAARARAGSPACPTPPSAARSSHQGLRRRARSGSARSAGTTTPSCPPSSSGPPRARRWPSARPRHETYAARSLRRSPRAVGCVLGSALADARDPDGSGVDLYAAAHHLATRRRLQQLARRPRAAHALDAVDEAALQQVGLAGDRRCRAAAGTAPRTSRLISRRARLAPRQKCGPPAPKPTCSFGVRVTSKRYGSANCALVAVGRVVEHHDLVAGLDLLAADDGVARRGAAEVDHRRRPAHDLLDRGRGDAVEVVRPDLRAGRDGCVSATCRG